MFAITRKAVKGSATAVSSFLIFYMCYQVSGIQEVSIIWKAI